MNTHLLSSKNELSSESTRIIQHSHAKGGVNPTAPGMVGFGFAIRDVFTRNGMVWEEVVQAGARFAMLKEANRSFTE